MTQRTKVANEGRPASNPPVGQPPRAEAVRAPLPSRDHLVLQALAFVVKAASDRVRGLSSFRPALDEGADGRPAASEPAPEEHLAALEANNREGAAQSDRGSPPMVKPPSRRIPSRLNDVDAGAAIELPAAKELAAGHVWPSVTGRNNIALAVEDVVLTSGIVVPWAPASSVQFHNDRWFLHTSARWWFGDEQQARSFFHQVVKRVVAHAADVPDKRTLALARDKDGYRLWVATPRCDSVALELLAEVVGWAVWLLPTRVAELLTDLRSRKNGEAADSPVAAGGFGLSREEGRLCLLAFEDDGILPPLERRVVSGDLVDLALEWFGDSAELRRMVEARSRRGPPSAPNR